MANGSPTNLDQLRESLQVRGLTGPLAAQQIRRAQAPSLSTELGTSQSIRAAQESQRRRSVQADQLSSVGENLNTFLKDIRDNVQSRVPQVDPRFSALLKAANLGFKQTFKGRGIRPGQHLTFGDKTVSQADVIAFREAALAAGVSPRFATLIGQRINAPGGLAAVKAEFELGGIRNILGFRGGGSRPRRRIIRRKQKASMPTVGRTLRRPGRSPIFVPQQFRGLPATAQTLAQLQTALAQTETKASTNLSNIGSAFKNI